jgi:AcrR family transcriptional regulator
MGWDRASTEALLRKFLLPEDAVSSKERKRRRMVAVAQELFVQFGYRKTSIGDVARAAGVAKGTVYLYFDSKAELLLHACMAEKAPLIKPFMALMDEADPRVRLREYLLFSLRSIQLLQLNMRFVEPGNDFEAALAELGLVTEMLEQHRTSVIGHLLGPFVLEHGGTASDLEERASALIGITHAMPIAMKKFVETGLGWERAAEVYADLLVEGFARPFQPLAGDAK